VQSAKGRNMATIANAKYKSVRFMSFCFNLGAKVQLYSDFRAHRPEECHRKVQEAVPYLLPLLKI
jgi:hypothetical protein